MTGRHEKREPLPAERHDTIRHELMHELDGISLSAREISEKVGISEKAVADHLEHIHRSLAGGTRKLMVTPAACISCGFVFRKRERMKKPGRCPVCHSEHIQDPLFSIIPR
ncbi:MAG: transcriptional regulator [Thermodesulfovibrionales bacterium]